MRLLLEVGERAGHMELRKLLALKALVPFQTEVVQAHTVAHLGYDLIQSVALLALHWSQVSRLVAFAIRKLDFLS